MTTVTSFMTRGISLITTVMSLITHRISLITALGGLRARPEEALADPETLGVVVAQVDVDYRAPLVLRPEPYLVETWVSRVGRSSFGIEGQIRDEDAVLSRCRVAMVAFDPAMQRSRRLTAAERARLEPALVGPRC